MAKDLPYFKFEPQAWDTGNIQMCSRESKGLFVDLCSLYWSRLGELPYALALQKLCNGTDGALHELKKHQIFGVVDDQIVIDFLDEQLLERNLVSEERRKAAKKRWSDANALQMESKSNARRGEEKREEKRKEEENKPLRAYEVPFVDGCLTAWEEWEKHRAEIKKKLTPSTAKKQIQFLGGRAGPEIIEIINQSITNGWTGLFELKNNTHARTTNQGSAQSTTTIIPTGKSFGVEKGFSRSGPNGGGK